MRSLGFSVYLPKLSSIKSLWLLRQKVKKGQGLERNLTFFYFYQGSQIMSFQSCFSYSFGFLKGLTFCFIQEV